MIKSLVILAVLTLALLGVICGLVWDTRSRILYPVCADCGQALTVPAR